MDSVNPSLGLETVLVFHGSLIYHKFLYSLFFSQLKGNLRDLGTLLLKIRFLYQYGVYQFKTDGNFEGFYVLTFLSTPSLLQALI